MSNVDAEVAALAVGVTAEVIRQWAARGKIRRVGRDHRGRVLYPLVEVTAVYSQRSERFDNGGRRVSH